jgi:hypothetical protein
MERGERIVIGVHPCHIPALTSIQDGDGEFSALELKTMAKDLYAFRRGMQNWKMAACLLLLAFMGSLFGTVILAGTRRERRHTRHTKRGQAIP